MKLSILQKELKFLIDGVKHSIEVNSYSPDFQNCLFEAASDNTLSIIVIANAQMAIRSIDVHNHQDEKAIVNIDTLNCVYRCLTNDNEYVVIESCPETNIVEFKFNKFTVKSELGKRFLNYRNFLPTTHETHGELKQPGLLYKALKPLKGKQHVKPMPLMIEKYGDILYFLLLKSEDTKDIVLKFDLPIHTYCRKDYKVNLDINKLLAMLEVVKNYDSVEIKFHEHLKGLTIIEPKSQLTMWLLPVRV